MRKRQKCLDAVMAQISGADRNIPPYMVVDQDKLRILEQYCRAFDDMAEDFDAYTCTASVDPELFTIMIRFESGEFVTRNTRHPFCQLLKRAVSMQLRLVNADTVGVEFEFPSVWINHSKGE